MNQSYHPFIGKVTDILDQEITLVDSTGRNWSIPVSAFEFLPKVGDSIALLALPQGGENAGKSVFAASILNELLSSD
ncbi:hypothetical protein IT408_04780 [Candidatus Uhrbacteria bacterium]|nr:hypothetical protein [Candidatus Uhrbacteria bacterium]